MSSNDAAAFTGSIPEHYDRNLGPILFVDYAEDIARRTAASGPGRVLETAAGTGIVTRKLRDALPAGTHLTATDLNAPMIEVARAKFRAGEQVELQPPTRPPCPSRTPVRRGRLPVRPDVLSRQAGILPRGASRAVARRPLSVQRLGLTPVQPVRPHSA